ncbi:OB-fold domain-containing protein [Williamsia sp. DF01-3]|uniref:Zn-ribbon domain-containing OB-fold protein n=1 Tax=Williamsia sp. DF01-3 TaxID=2934157 RepID=UPI001FF1D1E2|nr:OB-fold domain-containing protein [Williamsia sp. DF01-3]MCK0516689.1 OB-fold domain-containing protein [Williamsia sp. DF01-3]
MTDSLMLAPLPVPDPDSAPYWNALAEGKLKICRCVDTGTWIHPPLERSRITGGPVRFDEVSGFGTIFSYIVIRQVTVPGHQPPYVTAIIELDEQPGLRMTGVVVAEPQALRIGQRVKARIVDIGESGVKAPEFVLVDTDEA